MKKTSWGNVAGWYDELLEKSEDSYQKHVIMPNLLRIVAPKKGMNILDVACGQGYFTRAFAENGAITIGADVSPELIDVAQKNSPLTIPFYVASADSLTCAGDQAVDAVTIILALQNIENLAGAVKEVSRVLKKGGRFIFVLNHPAFRIPHASDWQRDEKTGTQFRRIDAYMSDSSTKIDMTPGEKDTAAKKFTVSFHRPLQVYVKALTKNNLAITRLEEWISHKKSEKGPHSAEEDRARKEIPLFLCIEATKF